MNVKHYQKRLTEIERELSSRISREGKQAREDVSDSPGDVGDRSVGDVAASDHFSAAELDGAILDEVREALRRVEAGTYGRCVVDGGPIETKRLDAVPWTRYCLKHQSLFEAAGQERTFTL